MNIHRACLGRTWPLGLAALLAMAPAWAQESLTVKELLDRAQTKPQTEAVEDLIRKLKGGARAPEKPPQPQPPPLAAKKSEPVAAEKAPPVIEPPPATKAVPAPDVKQAQPTKMPGAPPIEAATPQRPEPPAAPVVTAPSPAEPRVSPVATAPPQAEPPAAPVATVQPQAEPPMAPVVTAPPAPAHEPKTEVPQPLPSVDLEIPFDYKSAKITPQAVDLLAILGRALSDERLAGQTFTIAGHTDAKGGSAYNLKLSRARAEAVREFLVQHFGLAADRLIAEGHGYRQLKNPRMPFADENRRVQVTNMTPQTAQP